MQCILHVGGIDCPSLPVLMHIAIADIGMRFLAYCNNVKFDQSLNNIYESITGISYYKQLIFILLALNIIAGMYISVI